MRKLFLLIAALSCFIVFSSMALYAKTVLVELNDDASETWGFCKSAAVALNEVKKEYKNTIATLWYHSRDAYGTTQSNNRIDFYNCQYWPNCYTDGTLELIQGYVSGSRMKQHIDQRKTISAPITITIASSCPSSSGNATVTIKNTSAAAVSGTLQFAVKERGIKHAWQGMSYVENAVRSMIPNDKGEAVSISPGQTVTKTRAFTIGSGWVKDSCRLVAFVQKSDKEVVEACVSGVNVGTPVTTDKSSPVETIGIRQTKEAVMLYVPCKEKYTVSLMDVRGKTVATSTVEGNGGWLQLPRLTMHGIILIRIDMSGKRYVTRTFAGL